MKGVLMIFGIMGAVIHASAQIKKPAFRIEPVTISYKEKQVKAKKLTVSSEIPMPIDSAWANVKTPALLQFVAKGMISFKPTNGNLPEKWEIDQVYGVKMRIFGFLPFGGTHYLFIEKIDDANYEIATREWDNHAKVWMHQVKMRDIGDGKIFYEDAIVIYGGIMTGFITKFARRFYQHRQKRWQIVAGENLKFFN